MRPAIWSAIMRYRRVGATAWKDPMVGGVSGYLVAQWSGH
ncbi:Uncharacterised protein [Bordetella pertussis]|nr:Uncharacterised protein [Bordetella pertussis]